MKTTLLSAAWLRFSVLLLLFWGVLPWQAMAQTLVANVPQDKSLKVLPETYKLRTNNITDSLDLQVKLEYSPIYKDERKKTFVDKILRDTQGNIILIKKNIGVFRKSKDYIAAYNSNMIEIYNKELDLGEIEEKALRYKGTVMLAGKPFIYTTHHSKLNSKSTIYLLSILSDGNVGKPIAIAEWTSDAGKEDYQVLTSKDGAKLLVLVMLPIKKEDTQQKLAFTVYNDKLELLWTGTSAFQSERIGNFITRRRTANIRDVLLDSLGHLFVVITFELPNKEGKTSEYSTQLFQLLKGDNEAIKYNFDLQQENIVTLKLLEDSQNNELIGVGTYATYLYSRENEYSTIKDAFSESDIHRNGDIAAGTFLFRLDRETRLIKSKVITLFSKEIYDLMGVSEIARFKGTSIWGISLLHTHITPNGNVFMSLERKYSQTTVTTRTKYVNNVRVKDTYISRFYSSNIIINLKYDRVGNITYEKTIPRGITRVLGNYEINLTPWRGLNHYVIPIRERYVLLYNDHPDNMTINTKNISTLKTGYIGSSRCVAQLTYVDEIGNYKVQTLFNNKKDDFFLLPESSFQYDEHTIVTIVMDGKKFKLLKIRY